jgi:quercetin dioxygenase-like cupin family protein
VVVSREIEEGNLSTRINPRPERPLHGPLQSFDVKVEVSHLREEKEWRQGRRNAITLRKGGGLSLVLLVMRAGDRLEEHSAPGPISLSVREGRVRFAAGDEAVEAGAETVLACDAGVPHSVEALDDAVCLISIAAGIPARG